MRGMSTPLTIICPNPNCGYKGVVERRARGNIFIAIVLFCFGVLPGIVYLLLASGYNHYCPQCHMKQPRNLIGN
jgi:hypothetical protein